MRRPPHPPYQSPMSHLDDLPPAPPLRTAHLLGRRAAALGFDWPDHHGVLAKLDEERRELTAALHAADPAAITAEIGDLLFTLVNLCRHLRIDPEAALTHTNHKFARRFRAIEDSLRAEGRDVPDADLDDLEARWQAAKQNERSSTRAPGVTSPKDA